MNRTKTGAFLCLMVVASVSSAALAGEAPFVATPTITQPADGVQHAVAADFDADGDLDILSANFSANKVVWYENTDGAGTFGPEQVLVSGVSNPNWVLAADFDGGGDQDAAASVLNISTIYWFENTDGAGTFGPAQILTTAVQGPRALHAADLDADGDLDLMSAGSSQDTIAWYENRLNEVTNDFGPQQVISAGAADGVDSVVAADLDRDGDLDVLSASDEDDRIAWYENRLDEPSADFGPQQTISTNADRAGAVRAADIDCDGDLDAVSASFSDSKVAWYENRLDEPSADFSSEIIVSSTALMAVDVHPADMDMDGDVDLVAAFGFDEFTEWYENVDGVGTSWTAHTVDNRLTRSVFAEDMDGDGDPDLLTASPGALLKWHENLTIHRSSLLPARTPVTTTADGAYWVDVADLDNDGDLDVLSAAVTDHDISWYENTDGAGTFGPEQILFDTEFLARFVSASDLDRDGDLDVLSAGQSTNDISWFENRLDEPSADFGPKQEISDTFDGQAAWAALGVDLDSDGDPDVLATFLNSDLVVWYENRLDEPSADFGSMQTISSVASRPTLSTGVDLDLDGDLDVLVSAGGPSSAVEWYENRLNEVTADFGPQQIITTLVDLTRIAVGADFDSDGDPDVLSASADDNKVAWYENRLREPSADFGSQQVIDIVADSGIALSALAADLDGDGDLDVFAASQSANEIYWYENTDGAGTFSSQRLVSDLPFGPYGLAAADLDKDGDLDLLNAAQFDGIVAWHENRGGQFALATTGTAPPAICEGETTDVLQLVATHNGRTGDTDLELATLELLLEESPGVPLTSPQANALVERLFVYLDDGSGSFESGSDTLVTTVETLSLTGGKQTIPFADGDASVQVAFGTPRTYFVVAEMTPIAALQPQGGLCVTHVTEESSSAEDRDFDIPLSLEFVENATTCLVVPDADADGVCDANDNCPNAFNPGQENADADPDGNACDPDDDDDGILDDGDGSGGDGDNPCTGGATTGCDDNCPFDVNPAQSDGNGNGIGTACEVTCELVIGPQAGTDFPTIVAALPAAVDGCLLRVKPATYSAPLSVDKFVRILGEDGPATTIIDTAGSAVAVDIPPRNVPGRVSLQGFTIRDANVAIDTDESLDLTDCVIDSFTNTAIRLGLGDHRLTGIEIDGSSAPEGIVLDPLASANLDRVRVRDSAGTALSINGAATVVTSLLVDAQNTGIAVSATGSLSMSYTTVAGNGSGLTSLSSNVVADHCLIWGNTTDVTGVNCSAFTYCDLGVDCTAGLGNISADPLFVAPGSGDYHLVLASPAVEAGEPPGLYDGAPCLDFDGNRRLLDADGDSLANSDMGAYELDNSASLSPGDPQNLILPDRLTLSWDAEPSSVEYKINRGDLSTLSYDMLVECLGTSSSSTFGLTAVVPSVGDGFFYLVSGEDGGGEEGTLGFGTCFERSKILNPCP